MLITVLITYALLARRSEAIAWWASGQSVYRLMMPGLLFAVAVAGGTWLVQEHLMPAANVKQEALRTRIRGGQPRATTGTGRQWLASVEDNRIYSYEFDDGRGALIEPTIYELDGEGIHLTRVITGKLGSWTASNQHAHQGSGNSKSGRRGWNDSGATSSPGAFIVRNRLARSVPANCGQAFSVKRHGAQRLSKSGKTARRRCLGAGSFTPTQIRKSIQCDRDGFHRDAVGARVW